MSNSTDQFPVGTRIVWVEDYGVQFYEKIGSRGETHTHTHTCSETIERGTVLVIAENQLIVSNEKPGVLGTWKTAGYADWVREACEAAGIPDQPITLVYPDISKEIWGEEAFDAYLSTIGINPEGLSDHYILLALRDPSRAPLGTVGHDPVMEKDMPKIPSFFKGDYDIGGFSAKDLGDTIQNAGKGLFNIKKEK